MARQKLATTRKQDKESMSNYDEEKDKPDAPTMVRSRGQLSSSYAPGAFFTFEGGMGSCIAMPDPSSAAHQANIPLAVKDQILMRFDDAVKSWFDNAMNSIIRQPTQPQVTAEQCIDSSLLNNDKNAIRAMDRGRYIFVNPVKMGYAPAPLTFVCNHCGRFRSFENSRDFAKTSKSRLNMKCSKVDAQCQWRQLDVIFVHWSGNWEPVRPGKWDWDSNNNKIREPIDRCSFCHESDFILETSHSQSSIGKWFFRCSKCGNPDERGWIKNDRDSLEILGADFIRLPAQARMEPISYRASAAYYAQSDQFILFDEDQSGLLACLDISKQAELSDFIAGHFGYGRSRPSSDERKAILNLTEKGQEQLKKYSDKEDLLNTIPDITAPPFDKLARNLKQEMEEMVERWFTEGNPPLLHEANHLPLELATALQIRKTEFDTRYDPFRLAVEHEMLRHNHIDAPREATGRAKFVHFNKLDYDLAPKDNKEKERIEAETTNEFKKLGISTMGLIRNFKLCRFTYGYTRVGSRPTIEKHGMEMPVRLRLFDTVKSDQGSARPIYVVTQENEALYVRLDEETVYQWLRQLNINNDFEWKKGDISLGAKILEHASPMHRFLSNILPKQDPQVYYYVYTLLHTYSHVIMRAVAEHSGLDLGSLGEYIFPSELAFVVYRNGTTMDLGNLTSLWRNENVRFLKYLAEPRTLSCNSGSLCSASGGACPDCILIPETSCIASNQLLSRAVLRGGNAPREDGVNANIPGFIEVANARLV